MTYNRETGRYEYSKTCINCSNPFIATRDDARFCSPTCRKQASRAALAPLPAQPSPGKTLTTPENDRLDALADQTLARVDAAGIDRTYFAMHLHLRLTLEFLERLPINYRKQYMAHLVDKVMLHHD